MIYFLAFSDFFICLICMTMEIKPGLFPLTVIRGHSLLALLVPVRNRCQSLSLATITWSLWSKNKFSHWAYSSSFYLLLFIFALVFNFFRTPLIFTCRILFWLVSKVQETLHEKCLNAELFLVRIFLYSDWIQENTDQK